MSMKETAIALGLDTSSYTAAAKIRRRLSGIIRTLINWAGQLSGKAETITAHKAWHNA